MKTLQETLIDIATPESYDSLARGGDYDSATIDRAAKLAKNTKEDGDELKELKKQLRFFSDEMGERVLRGNEYNALVTPAKEPTTRLNTDRVEEVLAKLYGDDVLSRYMLDSCYESKTPAHRVTFVKK